MKRLFSAFVGTVKRIVLLRWLLNKTVQEFAAYERGLSTWKVSVGWDRGGRAMPGWVAANETEEQKALRKRSWNHFKMARVYDIARIRIKKQNASSELPTGASKGEN